MVKEDLFELSLPQKTPYRKIFVQKPQYKNLVTFEKSKKEPVYDWFYYKEGFSRELVWKILQELKINKGSSVLDPFCGTGNTLLASKQLGYPSLGCDISPLCVFVSNTKLQQGYDLKLLKEKIQELISSPFEKPSLHWHQLKFINIRRAFSQHAREDLLFFKEKILEIEDKKIRNFLLLGLLSIVGEVSRTKKDGGVLKIVNKKHSIPARILLKNRLKKMYKELKTFNQGPKVSAKANLGDARNLNISERFDICITSPPYLNFVDYTKVYGLELALLLANHNQNISHLRKKFITSFMGKKTKSREKPVQSQILNKTLRRVKKSPEVVKEYFYDMQLSMRSTYKALKKGAKAAIVISNSCFPNLTVDCDLILTEISQNIGFKPQQIWVANARWCEVGGIKKEKPVRESILILEK